MSCLPASILARSGGKTAPASATFEINPHADPAGLSALPKLSMIVRAFPPPLCGPQTLLTVLRRDLPPSSRRSILRLAAEFVSVFRLDARVGIQRLRGPG